jgi:hypothetical protein
MLCKVELGLAGIPGKRDIAHSIILAIRRQEDLAKRHDRDGIGSIAQITGASDPIDPNGAAAGFQHRGPNLAAPWEKRWASQRHLLRGGDQAAAGL